MQKVLTIHLFEDGSWQVDSNVEFENLDNQQYLDLHREYLKHLEIVLGCKIVVEES